MENESIERGDWVTEMVLPGVFTMILLFCLIHLGLQAVGSMAQNEPALGELSAISAFAS